MREARQSAQLALWQGDLPRARSLVQEGLSLAARDPDGPWVWTFRFLDAEVLLAERRLPDVLALVSTSIPGGRALDPARAHQRYLEARSLAAQGRLPDALAALDRARPQAPGDLRLDVDILEGQLRLQLGQWPQGEAALASVVERAQAAGDRYRQAVAFANLGMGQVTRGRHEDALFWFDRVLSFRDLEHYTVYATALSNAGICYTRLGEFDRALATERRAFEIHERRGPRIYFVQALGQLGNLYLLRGDAAEGLPYFRRALEVAIEAGLDADAALWAGNLASALVDLGQWDEAERLNAEARRLGAAGRSYKPAYHTLNAARIALGRGDLAAARRLFGEASGRAGAPGSSADGPGPDVRWSAEYGLARVALAERQEGRARLHFEAALDTIEQSRSDLLRTEYRLSYLTQLIRFYRAYVDALIAQGDVKRALEIADSSRGRVLAERHGVDGAARAGVGTLTRATSATFTQVASGSGAVLLFYWLGPDRSYLWAVTRDGVHLAPLPPAREIEALVRAHRSALESVLSDPLAPGDASGTPGDRLFRALVAPAARWIARDASVVIVPDGALHGLNFETLPVDGPRRHYWIEDVEIQVAPALAMLAPARGRDTRSGSLLLIGDATPRDPEYPALRHAGAEMRAVARHFPSNAVTRLEGERAAPSAYVEAGPGRFDVIHFTTHAAANTESPLDSAVILSGPPDRFRLYARDVAGVPLAAELVTVSACRSAGERAYSGEGLIGFAWAFLRAGSRRVVAGLWDVDDRSTAGLMDAFYGRLAAGERPARALRLAKLSMLGGEFAQPYYWGPFQIFTVSL